MLRLGFNMAAGAQGDSDMLTMKVIVVSSLFLTVGGGFVGCGSTETRAPEVAAVSAGSSDGASGARMRVDGLGCPMCAESISILMDKVDGVLDSHVDLSNGIVTVDLDPSVSVSGSELRAGIVDGGFTFRSIEFVK